MPRLAESWEEVCACRPDRRTPWYTVLFAGSLGCLSSDVGRSKSWNDASLLFITCQLEISSLQSLHIGRTWGGARLNVSARFFIVRNRIWVQFGQCSVRIWMCRMLFKATFMCMGSFIFRKNPVFPDGTYIKVGLNPISRQEYVMYENTYGRRIGHWCSAQFFLQSNNALNRWSVGVVLNIDGKWHCSEMFNV